MPQQTIDPAPPATEEAPEPERVVPMCECGTPPAAFVADPEAASTPAPGTVPGRAPHRVLARLFMRLPLWLRVTFRCGRLGDRLPLLAAAGDVAFTLDVLHLTARRLASSLEFFVYDSVKVLLLLTIVVFGVGVVRSFFSPQRTRALLHGRREATGNVMAASLGIVTPFCSCSAVPLFIGFVEAGIPLGRDLLVPHRCTHGERDRPGAPLRPLRLVGRGALPRHRPPHRHRRRLGHRPSQDGALHRGLGARDPHG